jgi:tRNA (guanine37-N1)-methyltransferase
LLPLLNKLKTMRIDIISVLPELLESPLGHSIIKRAQTKGLVEIELTHLRDFTTNKHRSVDDYAYGPDAGMVMMVEPIYKAVEKLKGEREYDEIIYTSPDGELLTQKLANQLSTKKNIMILCGHYKGIDHRVREHLITREISIGDYVLSGGELAAAVIVDSVVRLIPGVLSDETSALSDSFQDNLLAPPVYTRPVEFNGWKVPDILLSGNFKNIEKWQMEKSLERTKRLRPDLLKENE